MHEKGVQDQRATTSHILVLRDISLIEGLVAENKGTTLGFVRILSGIKA